MLLHAQKFATGIFVAMSVVTPSIQAELWGVRVGLCLAKSLGIHRLIGELDALLVVQSLQRPLEKNYSLGTLIKDCFNLIDEGWVTEVRHIHCEGNSCAGHLANLAQNNERGLVRLEMAPVSLEP
ncbi:hypothetical protein CXB51_024590 [Gossypium anomalum]|uniref:RNase H type-1 domain-containing protein n=1 Tax=Gossypium anomalum TaxID=47600 RepID=A0A8J5YJL9_9ROSI|nr:hypothetical protein CXB51_024590 [Gossypium anomalum]